MVDDVIEEGITSEEFIPRLMENVVIQFLSN